MKRLLIVTILIALLFITIGCESQNDTGSITVRVATSNDRTATPDKDKLAIAKYVVHYYNGSESHSMDFTESSCTITGLTSGTWSIYIDGYSSDSKYVAKSDTQDVVVSGYKNISATFQLKAIFDGKGTFNFKLGIPKDATDMNMINCSLISSDGTLAQVDFSFSFQDGIIEDDYSIFTYTNDIPAGSYNLKVETTNSLSTVFGIPINESVVIQANQETFYEHIWNKAFFPEVTVDVNNGGKYLIGVTIDISTNNENAKIHYAVDDANLSQNDSTIQTGLQTAPEGSKIKLMAILDGKWSRNGYYEFFLKGPAGGYVFYDCDADNTDENPKGEDGLISTECGWRYLEAAPSDLSSKYIFGYYRPDGKTNTYVGTGTGIGTGKSNTEALVNAMGDTAYSKYDTSDTTKAVYAAKACDTYSIEVDGVTYGEWFLPSKDELNLMYTNLHKKGLGDFKTDKDRSTYWSSSEDSYDYAWKQSFSYGNQYNDYRINDYYVRPIRAFQSNNLTIQQRVLGKCVP